MPGRGAPLDAAPGLALAKHAMLRFREMRERMGSGGLRGLQILRLGVKSARGGFDSHAFPPILALLLGLAVALPGAARAGAFAVIGDTVAARPAFQVDSSRIAPAHPDPMVRSVPDTVIGVPQSADTSGERRLGLFDEPRFVMARSLVFPGWGQAHNRAWFKAVGVATAEWYLITSLIHDNHALTDLNAEVEAARESGDLEAENDAVERYNARLDSFVSHQWWLGAVVIYALADAYVDAHFINFKFEFEHDRALRGHTTGVRLSVEKRF